MKNFLRALRHALPYRRRLVLSALAALFAAVFWGANFTAIYPVLELLKTEQSPHQWIDDQIAACQKAIDETEAAIDRHRADEKEQEKAPPNKEVEKRKRDLASELSRLETKQADARKSLYWYQVGRKYIYNFAPADCYQTLAWVIGLVVVGVAIKCSFEFVQESLVGSVVNLALFDLRNRFYRNVIHLDVNQFGKDGTSELMARFTNDMESLGTGLKMLFGKVVAEPLKALVCILIACYIHWQLTLMFLILVPIAGFVLARVARIMKNATRRLLERMSSIFKILQESFQGIRVVKAFTMEPYERRRFFTATKDYYHKSMRVVNIDALADPIIELLGVAAVAGALLFGAYLVLHRELTASTLLQLYALLAAIADPVRKLSSVFTRIQSGGAAADRIFAFLDLQPRVTRNPDGPRLAKADLRPEPGKKGRANFIEFRDVCFSYEPNCPILTNINLTVRAGETVAIVGQNGTGKTTLAGLLPRFYDPLQGSVLLNGVDIRTVNLRSLRQQIGIVTQESVLFEDTIHNNIAYGSRGATPEQVEAAARKALAHDFIVEHEQGYQRRLGEGGLGLSGGQRQRLALARAILRDPSILILDEFTSQADTASEAEVHRAMREFMVGRTSFIITHKLHTLETVDRIIVLEANHLAGVGTHAELLATCPAYQRLYDAFGRRMVA
jgi:ATP-binding cassette subfamily B protein/subfamily B ATP-binding cassette protein MsbA